MNCWAETGARLLIAASAAQRRRFRADLTQPVSDRDWARRGGGKMVGTGYTRHIRGTGGGDPAGKAGARAAWRSPVTVRHIIRGERDGPTRG
jgi:hypothetical protein